MPDGRRRHRRQSGYYAKHVEQQKALIDTAFGKLKGLVLNK